MFMVNCLSLPNKDKYDMVDLRTRKNSFVIAF